MGSPFRLIFDPAGPVLDAARACEADVFLSWFGNTRDQLVDEYGPYEDRSVFLAVANEDDEVLASARLLVPGSHEGFKTFADIEHEPWGVDSRNVVESVGIDVSSTWEVATISARTSLSAERSPLLSLALYHGLMTIAHVNYMSSFVAVLDQRVRRLLASVGILTQVLPGTAPASYLGSPSSVPVYAHYVPLRDNQRRRFPDAYRLVTLGTGLDGVDVPSAAHFRFDRRTDRVLNLTAMEQRVLSLPGAGATTVDALAS